VYLDSSSTHTDHDVWLIDLGACFHMTPHIECFFAYDKYNRGDVFLGDDLTAIITTRGKVKLLLKDGRIRAFNEVLHIQELDRNSIYVSNMSDASVHIMFENETRKMV
jgi:hypothetical protein